MQKILARIAETYVQTEDGRNGLVKYFDMKAHPGWKVHQSFLVHMGSLLADEVLTRQFQKLETEERLSKLAAYSMVSEIIKFLIDPTKVLEKMAGIAKHNIQAENPRRETRKKE